MSAQYQVTFQDGRSLYVSSADAKSAKAKDVRESYRRARVKAEAKRPGIKAVEVRCVG